MDWKICEHETIRIDFLNLNLNLKDIMITMWQKLKHN